MKNLLSLFFILVFSLVFSQKTISGVVKNNEGDPVASASVTVEEPGNDAIIAYSITNAKGEYKVTFTSAAPKLDLKIKAFNHKSTFEQVANDNLTKNFTVQSETTQIEEVKLKTKLITKRGDTITYDIKAFDSKADRTLADVLKKMPGIEVGSDGSILYNGEPINKFYVNGKDLMEGGYGTINNALPKDAVQKVEVLENHQPVKMLQGKIGSDQAAINVQLKNKVTMTGRGEVGTGFADPWLWNVKLTPMFFGQKSQWVVNYKTNNVGETVENEGNILGMGNRWEGRRGNASQDVWLGVENASTPDVPVRRYLFNNVHFLSANYLTNLDDKKEWELKASANYTNNTVERESYSESTQYDEAGNSSKISSNIFNRFYTDKVKGELIFTKNAKEKFFKNVTSFTQFWNADRALVDRFDEQRFGREAIEKPTSSFQNSLSTILPWKEKMINLQSYISYQNDGQTLEIFPANYVNIPNLDVQNANGVFQNLDLQSLEANHSANVSFTKKFWTFTPEVGFNFSKNDLETSLFKDQTSFGEEFANDLSYTTAVPYGSVRVNYKNESWNVFSNFPVNFNNIKAEDPTRNVSKSVNKITFEPSAFVQYSFLSFWKASVSGSLGYNFGEIGSAYAGRILSSPNSLNSMSAENPIPENLSKTAGTRIEYRNPLNNLFFNVRYGYSRTDKNLLTNRIFNTSTGFSETQFLDIENFNDSNSYSAEIGKYFPKYKSNIALSFRNTDSRSEISYNDNPVVNKNNSQSYSFKLNNTYFDWMSLDYNMSFSVSKLKSINDNSSKGYNHNLSAFFYPKDNHTIGFYWDQLNSSTNNETNNQSYKNPFFDVSYQYTWDAKKIDFELKWMNIANRDVYEEFSVDNTSDNYTRMKIRPSQVMFTVKFNFK